MEAALKSTIYENLNILATNNLGKYLGFPLKYKGSNRNQFNFVAERAISKLLGWKAQLLSFAGMTILVKSVMLASYLCDKLDKISRDFLWGTTQEKKKTHMVGWSKIIKPKDEGLGIQEANAKNVALLVKLNWRMYHK